MRYLVAFLLLAVAGLANSEEPRANWGFLFEEREYHSGEAPAKPGTGWLALVVVDGMWQLVPTKIRAERVHDVVLDAEGEKTGIRISSTHPEALARLRGEGLRAGKVETPNMRFTGKPRDISPERPINIEFKGESYQIVVVKSEVYLKKGKQRTKLPSLTVFPDPGSDFGESATLLWAGDLEGDGKLDLIVMYGHYNGGGACLFVSSFASPGELIGHVACHGGVGC